MRIKKIIGLAIVLVSLSATVAATEIEQKPIAITSANAGVSYQGGVKGGAKSMNLRGHSTAVAGPP